MSRLRAGMGVSLDLTSGFRAVAAALGSVPPVVGAVLKMRLFDIVTHHRRSVLKHQTFPGGRSGQKFLAATMKRYSRSEAERGARSVGATAESFTHSRWPGFFGQVERGGTVRSARKMLVPFMATLRPGAHGGVVATSRIANPWDPAWWEANRERIFITKRGVVVLHMGRGTSGDPSRSRPVALLRRSRRQRPILGFFSRWDAVLPRAVAAIDADFERLLSDQGRAQVEKMLSVTDAQHEETFVRRMLRGGFAKGSSDADVEAAKARALRHVRVTALDRGGGGG